MSCFTVYSISDGAIGDGWGEEAKKLEVKLEAKRRNKAEKSLGMRSIYHLSHNQYKSSSRELPI